ncbi:MAG TPA: LacI family DNA-binding transcriptional regulator [Actinocrinis sp.]|jgi:LacI family transcriptional regulator|uniref:LacI family DNA-binding transcriptional regulator n=1 Tax=Actinocrinis sp. TaxID=1920516 RepID=UPI002DDD92C1|nr:LacI family DNA-binding transcriptional regulator [Actinocrinis sp.]HEV3171013.1 LacI family DNA-binding transcriptional regulator [Actinocrinis sp.]
MNDVAAAAGVGLKTVSRVVNGEPGVAEETASRVRAVIDQLGFRRNDSARLLRQRRRTLSIGLVTEDLADPFYSQLGRAVEEVARSHGALLLAGSSDEDPVRERELALNFCARQVDGLIVVPAGADHSYLAPELAAGTAVVSVDRPVSGVDVDTVLADNRGGIRDGVSHFLRQGHRKIGYVGDSLDIFTAAERCTGYRHAMADAGLDVEERWVSTGRPGALGVRLALDRMLSGPEPVTALLCGNNRTTVTVLRELATRRNRPALIGFDDFELADMVAVPVTVIAQDPTQMGRMAAELLFRRMRGERAPTQRIELPTRLILRGSGEIRV